MGNGKREYFWLSVYYVHFRYRSEAINVKCLTIKIEHMLGVANCLKWFSCENRLTYALVSYKRKNETCRFQGYCMQLLLSKLYSTPIKNTICCGSHEDNIDLGMVSYGSRISHCCWTEIQLHSMQRGHFNSQRWNVIIISSIENHAVSQPNSTFPLCKPMQSS